MAIFSEDQLRAIADALADTDEGLTGSEIAHLLETCRIRDIVPNHTKRWPAPMMWSGFNLNA